MKINCKVLQSKNPEVRNIYLAARARHVELADMERLTYDQRVMQAQANPSIFLSCAMDFMTKLPIPHCQRKTHAWNGIKKLNILSNAILDHTEQKVVFTQVPHCMRKSSNLMCSLFMAFLHDRVETTKKPLPPILFLQVDSCTGENKNSRFFGFLGWLIAQKIFKDIVISYLLPGHTHIDLDRNFSFHEVFLRSHNYSTFNVLQAQMKVVSSFKVSIYFSISLNVISVQVGEDDPFRKACHQRSVKHEFHKLKYYYDWNLIFNEHSVTSFSRKFHFIYFLLFTNTNKSLHLQI